MRVLMLTWEYPPESVGGLACHVHELAHNLSRLGVEVHVVTRGKVVENRSSSPAVHAVAVDGPETLGFADWVVRLNLSLTARAGLLFWQVGLPYIIHAHDWLVVYCARSLKHTYRLPLVATVHATEQGRSGDPRTPLQRLIANAEWWLTYEAWKVICCSRHMHREIASLFSLPADKIEVIPNGVSVASLRGDPRELSSFRREYALPHEKLVLFVGRLVREKGVQILLEAVRPVVSVLPQVRFAIVGAGSYEPELRQLAAAADLERFVRFCGRVDDETRNALYRCADVAVFPSLYEPFGIVALEAMACAVPVAAADTGGFGEIICHGRTGWLFPPADPRALARTLLEILHRPELASLVAKNAAREVEERYTWEAVARRTKAVYERVWEERRRSPWVPVSVMPVSRFSGLVSGVGGSGAGDLPRGAAGESGWE